MHDVDGAPYSPFLLNCLFTVCVAKSKALSATTRTHADASAAAPSAAPIASAQPSMATASAAPAAIAAAAKADEAARARHAEWLSAKQWTLRQGIKLTTRHLDGEARTRPRSDKCLSPLETSSELSS